MTTKRPIVLVFAVICLVILVLFSSGLALARNFGLGGMGLSAGRFPGGRMSGNIPQGGFPQGGFSQGSPRNRIDPGQLPENFNNPNDQGFPPRMAFFGLSRVIRWLGLGLSISALIIGLLAAAGVWRQKKWGAILAIILAVLLLLTSLTGLFSFFSWLTFGEALLKVFLAITVIVLLLLPAARKAYASPPEPEF